MGEIIFKKLNTFSIKFFNFKKLNFSELRFSILQILNNIFNNPYSFNPNFICHHNFTILFANLIQSLNIKQQKKINEWSISFIVQISSETWDAVGGQILSRSCFTMEQFFSRLCWKVISLFLLKFIVIIITIIVPFLCIKKKKK